MLKLTKVQAGWYATADGRFAVVSDGVDDVVSQKDRDGSGVNAGIVSREWAALADEQGRLRDDHDQGEVLSWFNSKTQAVGFLQRHTARQEARI